MNKDIPQWKTWFQDHQENTYRDFFRFLQFKTIATDPAYHDDCLQCADWLKTYLEEIGLSAQLWETSSQPVVFAKHCKAGDDRPTLLLYHHYDVQPIDPLELWESDPFTPEIREGEVYARGAQDNKGQCFYTLTALKALFELCESFSFNLKVFIEGEEESGSAGTKEAIEQHIDDLKSDYLLVVDVGLPAADIPAITLGARGIIICEIKVRASNGDLHSGMLGGAAYNPNRALATCLAKIWDEEGRVAIPHFYDDVKEFSEEELAELDLEVEKEELKRDFGMRAFCPDPGYSVGQSMSIRPTVEINGMNGGYTGEGFKTVIPSEASAKISCRLVQNQDPKKIIEALKAHLSANIPKGLEVEITCDEGAPAFCSSKDAKIAKLTKMAYEEVMNKPCKSLLTGGSIPIVTKLAQTSGAETILMGFGLDTDQMHAPNEHFGVDRFELGFLTMGRIFNKIHELS